MANPTEINFVDSGGALGGNINWTAGAPYPDPDNPQLTRRDMVGNAIGAGINWRGAWSSLTAYSANDAVSLSGASYICILANTNQMPPNATYWAVLAQAAPLGGVNKQSGNYTAIGGDDATLIAFNTTIAGTAPSVSYTANAGNNSSASSISASSVNTAAGDLIVVAIRTQLGTTSVSSVTDTAGNVYKQISRQNSGLNLELWYAYNAIANASNVIVANFSTSDSFSFIFVWGITNCSTIIDPGDVSAGATGTGTTATSSAYTTTQAKEIIIAAVSTNSGGITFSAGSGFTLDNGAFPVGLSTNDYGGAEHEVVSTIQTAATAAFTWTGSHTWDIVVGTFKENLGANYTLTLPGTPPSSSWVIFVSNYGLGTVTISPNGLDLDGSSSSVVLLPGQRTSIFTDGTNYFRG